MVRGIAGKILFLFVFVGLFHSCFKEEFDIDKLTKGFELNPDLVFPIGYGSLSITDLVKESDTIRYNEDTIEIYIRKDTIFTIGDEDFFTIPNETQKDLIFDLGNREISEENISKSVSIKELSDLLVSPNPLVDGVSPFPALSNNQSGIINLDDMTNFQWLQVSTGDLEMTVVNNLPVNISSYILNIRNTQGDTLVASYNFINIVAGSSQVKLADITGKKIRKSLYVEVIAFSTDGANVPVNFADDIEMNVRTVDVEVSEGIAILPDQVFDSDTSLISLNLEGDEEVYTLELSNGYIRYTLKSYVNEDIQLLVTLPNTAINGDTVKKSTLVLASGAGETVDSLMLTESITTLENNGIPAIYTTMLVSSGRMVYFNFADTVNYNSKMERVNIEVKAATGFFGTDTINISNESFENEMDLFSSLTGSFELTNPQINITYSNSYGIPLILNLNFLGEYFDDDNVALGTPAVSFNYPSNVNDDPYQGVISFNKNNLPQIVNFLKFPPADIIHYSGNALSNPGGKTAVPNFIGENSFLTVGLELKLPLDIRATNVVLRDTIVFDAFSSNEENGSDSISVESGVEFIINEANLIYNIKNGFPLDLDFQIILYDSINDIKYDTVNISGLNAAPVNERGIVIDEGIDQYSGEVEVDDAFMDNLRETANKIIIVGTLNTTKDDKGNAKTVKILNTYNIEFHAGFAASVTIKTN